MTMIVAGILVAIAVPAFNTFVLNDRDIGQINSLVSSLNYARSEAVKVASPTGITVCPSAGGTTCAPAAPWSGGWIVVDTNNADCGGAACTPLQSIPALAGANTLTAVGGAAAGHYILIERSRGGAARYDPDYPHLRHPRRRICARR